MQMPMSAEEFMLYRRKRRMTQGDIAKALGVSRLTVNNWERQRFAVPKDIVERLAAIETPVLAAEQRANDAQRRKEMQNQLAWYRYWREIITHEATMAKAPAPLYPETIAILTGEFTDFAP